MDKKTKDIISFAKENPDMSVNIAGLLSLIATSYLGILSLIWGWFFKTKAGGDE